MIYSCPAERLELEISGFNVRELELARGRVSAKVSQTVDGRFPERSGLGPLHAENTTNYLR